MKNPDADPPEAPPQWDNTEAAAWQQGWATGHAAALARIAALEAAMRPFAATSDEIIRCEHCGWPLVAKGEPGCWAESCSQRPMPPKRDDIRTANDRVLARLALEGQCLAGTGPVAANMRAGIDRRPT